MRPPRLLMLGLLLLGSCAAPDPLPERVPSAPLETGVPAPRPTPTPAPTNVPGSSADRDAVAAVVAQFGDALVQEDDLVALLVLSPSAQKVVAATGLPGLLGRPLQPDTVAVGAVAVRGDLATAELRLSYAGAETPLRLRLVRLDEQWRIDGRAGE